jgi:hypothetical protein
MSSVIQYKWLSIIRDVTAEIGMGKFVIYYRKHEAIPPPQIILR